MKVHPGVIVIKGLFYESNPIQHSLLLVLIAKSLQSLRECSHQESPVVRPLWSGPKYSVERCEKVPFQNHLNHYYYYDHPEADQVELG